MPYISGLPEYNVSWEHTEARDRCLVYEFIALPPPSSSDIRDIRESILSNTYRYARMRMHIWTASIISQWALIGRVFRSIEFVTIPQPVTRIFHRACVRTSDPIMISWDRFSFLFLRKVRSKNETGRTWTAPSRDSGCKDFPASGPTKGSLLRNRCSSRMTRPPARRRLLARTTICISIPTAPNTSSSSRDSTVGRRACRKICRRGYRPPRRRTGPWGRRAGRRAPPRSGAYPRTALLDLLPAPRNTCTTCIQSNLDSVSIQ